MIPNTRTATLFKKSREAKRHTNVQSPIPKTLRWSLLPGLRHETIHGIWAKDPHQDFPLSTPCVDQGLPPQDLEVDRWSWEHPWPQPRHEPCPKLLPPFSRNLYC